MRRMYSLSGKLSAEYLGIGKLVLEHKRRLQLYTFLYSFDHGVAIIDDSTNNNENG